MCKGANAGELCKAEKDILGRETIKISRQEEAWQVLGNSCRSVHGQLGYKGGDVKRQIWKGWDLVYSAMEFEPVRKRIGSH